MALSFTYKLIKTNDVALFYINNTTVYGTPEEDRNEAAEILLAAYVNESGVEQFITVDSTPYLTKTEYAITNTLDGHYHFETLRFPLWINTGTYVKEIRDVNDIITTYANLVYGTTTGKFYKAIEPSNSGSPIEPGITVGWETYWEEITDFTDSEVRSNDTIVTAEYDDIHDARATICTKNELYKVACGDHNCIDLKKLTPYLKRAALLAGARAKRDDQQPEKAESILRVLTNLCGKC